MTDKDVMKEISHILKRKFPEGVVPTVVCTVDFIKGVYNLIDRCRDEVCYFEDLIDDINREKNDQIEYLSFRLRKEENKNSKLWNERNRLKARNDELNTLNKTTAQEAIKEFAERMKQVYWSNSLIDVCIREMVDNLVKEMTEGSNDKV